ncbi:CheY-like superfamily [Suillus spraguei]|nr:CheY-like superfamily [Suillus spraguei]
MGRERGLKAKPVLLHDHIPDFPKYAGDYTAKMQSFHRRAILFVDTLNDTTGVDQMIRELGLRPYVVHDVSEVADKERCPHIKTIVVDSLSMTQNIREYEHLRYIPVVLLAPSMPRLNREYARMSFGDMALTVTAQDLISALEPNPASPVWTPNDVVFDILLAEDNMVNQKLVVKILERCGHRVMIAENGSQAVEAFKARVQVNKPFDIILTPIIALTAHAMIDDRERCLQAGMDDHITKPLHHIELLNLINRLVGMRAQLTTQHHLLHRPPTLMVP